MSPPSSFRRRRRRLPIIILLTLGLPAAAQPFPPGNWLADGGFEQRAEAREIGLPSGADRRDFGEVFGWRLDETRPWEGRRSLRLSGARPFTWRLARDFPSEGDAVFSVYVRGDRPGAEVEVGFEVFALDDHYAIGPRAMETRRTVLTPDWQRMAVPLRVDKKTDQGHIRVHLVKAWVRSLTPGRGDVWIDGAQLEVDRAEPGAFTSMMPALPVAREAGNLLRDWLGRESAKDLTPSPPARSPAGEVAFTVRETRGVARREDIAEGGIVFAPGALFPGTALRVTDERGNPVPAQTDVLATRPLDGSVIALLVSVPATLSAHEEKRFVLHHGPAGGGATEEAPVALASESGGRIVLRTGKTSRAFSSEDFAGFEVTLIDGSRYVSEGLKPDFVRIERNGPLHAVVAVRGRVADARRQELGMSYECRFHAYAGSDVVQVELSYEQGERVSHLPVRSVGLSVAVTEAGGGEVEIGTTDGAGKPLAPITVVARQSFAVTQLHQYFGEGRYDLALDTDGRSQRREGVRAGGGMSFPGVALGVKDFSEMNPAAVAWQPGRLTLYAQPPRHASYVELPFGISQTVRVWLGPAAERERVAALAAAPLRVLADPAHTARAGVFGGHHLTSAEARAYFPGFEQPLAAFFSTFSRNVRRQDTTGGFDYGDAGSPAGWKNNETALIEALFLQYLRDGDPEVYARAEAMVRQFRDVALLHASPDSKWIQTHAAAVHTTGHWHIGHFWPTGLIWHYFLTGDRRSYEAARGTAAELLSRHAQRYTGRERGRMLLHLAELYELTHYRALREAFERHLAHDVPMETGAYYAGLNILALGKWRSAAGETPELRRRLSDYGRQLLETVAATDLLTTIGEDRDHYVFSAAALLASMTDDPAYVTAFADRLPLQSMSVHGAGLNAVRGAEFLYQARRLGVASSALTPAACAGVALLSGRAGGKHDATLELRLRTGDSDGPPARLNKLVSFRAGKAANDDALAYRVVEEATGREVKAGRLAGPSFETFELGLEPRADHRLSIACLGDAQVEAVDGGEWSLAADRWVFFRQHRHGSGFVAFDVVPAERGRPVTLDLDWTFTGPGAVAGVELLAPDGTRVSHARWAKALGVEWDDRGQPMMDPAVLELALPAGLEGTLLRMEKESAKWLGWRVRSGLAEPWLRAPAPR